MGIIKAKNLVHEFIRRDEEGNVESINTALDHVNLDVKQDEFANKLLQSKKVAVVPGTAFGASGEGFIRISYAYSLEDLKLALSRVEEFINELRAAK